MHNDKWEDAEAYLRSGLEKLKAFHDCTAGNCWTIKFLAELGDIDGAQSQLAKADKAGFLRQEIVTLFLHIPNAQFQTSQNTKAILMAFQSSILANDFERAFIYYQALEELQPDYFTEEAAGHSATPYERFF
jgi:hypothetical protein